MCFLLHTHTHAHACPAATTRPPTHLPTHAHRTPFNVCHGHVSLVTKLIIILNLRIPLGALHNMAWRNKIVCLKSSSWQVLQLPSCSESSAFLVRMLLRSQCNWNHSYSQKCESISQHSVQSWHAFSPSLTPLWLMACAGWQLFMFQLISSLCNVAGFTLLM